MDDSLYDLSKLREISKGNQQFISKMIQIFIEQVPIAVAEIKGGFESKDYKKVRTIAHKIKTSIDFMGITILKEDIMFIENNAELLKSSSQMAELISKLELVTNKVVVSLKESLN